MAARASVDGPDRDDGQLSGWYWEDPFPWTLVGFAALVMVLAAALAVAACLVFG